MNSAEVLVVEFDIHPVHVTEFERAISANACDSLALESGCSRFDICRVPQQPNLFFLYEIYDDEAAVQAHLSTSHFQQFDVLSRSWVASKTVRCFQLSVPRRTTA